MNEDILRDEEPHVSFSLAIYRRDAEAASAVPTTGPRHAWWEFRDGSRWGEDGDNYREDEGRGEPDLKVEDDPGHDANLRNGAWWEDVRAKFEKLDMWGIETVPSANISLTLDEIGERKLNREFAFWKSSALQAFLLKLVEDEYPEKEIPRWVNYTAFLQETLDCIFTDLVDALNNGDTKFESLGFIFALVAGCVDTGASDIRNYADNLLQYEIPKDIIDAWRTAAEDRKNN